MADSDNKIRMTVAGRLWKRPPNEAFRGHPDNDSMSGYIELGLLGRLHVVAMPNERRSEKDADIVLLISVNDTPYGMIKKMSRSIDGALYEDEENPYVQEA